MNDFDQIYRMTLYEYRLRMEAFRLQRVDRDFDLHLLAWESWNVQAMKQSGRKKRVPVFKTFKEFFDYEAEIKKARGGTDEKRSRFLQIAGVMRKQKEEERKEAGDGKL